MAAEPVLAVVSPSFEDGSGDEVARSPSDEVAGSLLGPVGEVILDFIGGEIGVVRAEGEVWVVSLWGLGWGVRFRRKLGTIFLRSKKATLVNEGRSKGGDAFISSDEAHGLIRGGLDADL